VLLNRRRRADRIDFSPAVVDSSSVRVVFGGRNFFPILRIAAKTARNTMLSQMETASNLPTKLIAVNCYDVTQLLPLEGNSLADPYTACAAGCGAGFLTGDYSAVDHA